MKRFILLGGLFFLSLSRLASAADQVLLEAESFQNHGGWVLDTQFIQQMGSPYLLAHGLGRPVKDATTEVVFPSTGTYRVLVRTKDWVARWDAPASPGRFQVLVNGQPLAETFGNGSSRVIPWWESLDPSILPRCREFVHARLRSETTH